MGFYVNQSEFMRLSGRSRQGLQKARRTKNAVTETCGSEIIFDLDNEINRKYLANFPSNYRKGEKEALREYQKDFFERRSRGLIKCHKTGNVDLLGGDEDLFLQDEETIDRRKKQRDVEYREKQIEKLDVTLMAMRGGLIERDHVMTWISRYIGTMHTQILEMATAGICDDLYALAHKHKDSREAIKHMEKLVGEAGSKVIKGAIEAMEKNQL